jgi:glycerol-3-phosphate acyltransferase PlsY
MVQLPENPNHWRSQADRVKILKELVLMIPAVYVAASVNFSIFIFRLLGKGDPRNRYSGNAGTVNVVRQLGLIWGLVILLLDLCRAGAVAMLGVKLLPAPLVCLLGFFLVLGNQKPILHGFHGGKGVASYLGFSFVISPFWAGISCLFWIVVYALVGKPFIGSFFMIAALGLGTMIHSSWSVTVVIGTSLTMALIYLAHKPNVVAWRRDVIRSK